MHGRARALELASIVERVGLVAAANVDRDRFFQLLVVEEQLEGTSADCMHVCASVRMGCMIVHAEHARSLSVWM